MKQAMLAGALLLAAGTLLISQREDPAARPGPLPGGGVLLNTGWTLRPAGRQIELSTFPMAVEEAPGGRFIVIIEGGPLPSITVLERPAMRRVASRRLEDAWLGLRFAPGGGLFYVSGGSRARVHEFALDEEGRIEERRTFILAGEDERKPADFTGDVMLSPDGRFLYAAGLFRDTIWAINLQSGAVTGEWKTVHRPYRLLFHPDERTFWVTGWGSASVARHDANSGSLISHTAVGPSPMDMALRMKPAGEESGDDPFRARLYVAVANTNAVAVLGVTDDGQLRQIERINVAFSAVSPAGMTPSALALPPERDRLFVVCSDANAVAVVNLTGKRPRLEGWVPVGWYPTAARVLGDGSLLVLNGRGSGSDPDPNGPNPGRGAPVEQDIPGGGHMGVPRLGTASWIPPFDAAQLNAWTGITMRNTPYSEARLHDAGIMPGNPVPSRPGDPSPIQHAVYIVKENLTYDQVLGGLGAGGPAPAMSGEAEAPNHRQLARDFVLLDNFHVNGGAGADGLNWSAAAIAPAFVQRLWPNSPAGRRHVDGNEGAERAAQPPAAYIWNNALAAGLTVRNYGWFVNPAPPAQAGGGIQIAGVRDPALEPHTSKTFRGPGLDYRDIDRARAFIAELKQFEANNSLPRFIAMRLGNDRASGAEPVRPTPKARMADHDLALGMIVEALSRSKFWAKTAVFVIEGGAGDGPGRADSHRAPAYVISPYTRGRGIDSTFYNTVSVLRTMGLILGLRPMTIHDAGARPMAGAFMNRADPAPYPALRPLQPLEELSPPGAPRARQ